MFGLSSGNTSNSYKSMDYALYADSTTNKHFVIYESGRYKRDTGTSYDTGDYMKVVRSGTTVKYYHIKAADGPDSQS
jgi:hypothetical protein